MFFVQEPEGWLGQLFRDLQWPIFIANFSMLITILDVIQAKSVGISCCWLSKLTPLNLILRSANVYTPSKKCTYRYYMILWQARKKLWLLLKVLNKIWKFFGICHVTFLDFKDQILLIKDHLYLERSYCLCINFIRNVYIWLMLTREVSLKGGIRPFVICNVTFLELKDWNL